MPSGQRFTPLEEAHERIARESEPQPIPSQYEALHQQQDLQKAEQELRATQSAPEGVPKPSRPEMQREPPLPQTGHVKALEEDGHRQERLVAAFLTNDEPGIAAYREDQLSRGYRGYEINNEINQADQIAQSRQQRAWEADDATRASAPEGEKKESGHEMTEREARRAQFLADRQTQQELEKDKGDDLDIH